MTIRNVTIGDKFKQGKNIICEVIDFVESKSLITGNTYNTVCIARGVGTIANNSFEVPFSTVIRNKLAAKNSSR